MVETPSSWLQSPEYKYYHRAITTLNLHYADPVHGYNGIFEQFIWGHLSQCDYQRTWNVSILATPGCELLGRHTPVPLERRAGLLKFIQFKRFSLLRVTLTDSSHILYF